ncbi:MAG: hypothetical protein M3O22_09300, partial [Pseudomonadota bacterium]|nr:hypothetical protein [Pseudomonadota bacterium]
HITLSLPYALVVGLPVLEAIAQHELSHAWHTVTLETPEMREMTPWFNALEEKEKRGEALSPEEKLFQVEYLLRLKLRKTAEEPRVNTDVVRREARNLKNYAAGLNRAMAILGPPLDRPPGKPVLDDITNLLEAIKTTFFAKNGLFPDTPAGYEEVGVDTGAIRSRGKPLFSSREDFNLLRHMVTGQGGICSKLPPLEDGIWASVLQDRDREDGTDRYRDHIMELAGKACDEAGRIVDRIWKYFAPPLEMLEGLDPSDIRKMLEEGPGDNGRPDGQGT